MLGLAVVYLVAPTTEPARRARIAARTGGFLYCVSLVGVTGARASLPASVGRLVRDVRAVSPVPVAVGFGVSRPAHVRALVRAGADGVIVASALVDALGPDGRDVARLGRLVADLRSATVRLTARSRRRSNRNRGSRPLTVVQAMTIPQTTEPERLVIDAQAGDRDAFRSLVEPHVGPALGASIVLLRSHADAADAVQDALLSAWLGLPSLRDPLAFPAWFRRHVVRAALRSARRRRPVVELDLAATVAGPEGELDRALDRRRAAPCLRPTRAGRSHGPHPAAPVGPAGQGHRRGPRDPGRYGQVTGTRRAGTTPRGVRCGGTTMTDDLELRLSEALHTRARVDIDEVRRVLDAIDLPSRPASRLRLERLAAAVVVIGLALGGLAIGLTSQASHTAPRTSLTATAEDGTFRLTLTTDRGIYAAWEAIGITASLTYLGPADMIEATGTRKRDRDAGRPAGRRPDDRRVGRPAHRACPIPWSRTRRSTWSRPRSPGSVPMTRTRTSSERTRPTRSSICRPAPGTSMLISTRPSVTALPRPTRWTPPSPWWSLATAPRRQAPRPPRAHRRLP